MKLLLSLSNHISDAGLRCYAAMLATLNPGLETVELQSDALDTILDVAAARRCDLILIGQRTNARRLAMQAPCSVWIAPDGSAPTISRILVPIDFSPRSADTLDTATAIARSANLDECIALHVYFNRAVVTFDEFEEILVEDAARAFDLFIAPIDLHDVYAKPLMIESSNVAQTILRTAAEQHCDLVVMGTRGRSRSAAVLLGSETEQVLIHSPVPVLAVKHFGARMRLLQALRDERVRRRAAEDWYI